MLSGCAAAGGFEPPLPGAVETRGWRVAKLATRWHEVPALQIPSNDNAPGNCFQGRFVSYTSKRL